MSKVKFGLVLVLMLSSLTTIAEVETKECGKQLEKLLLTTVDCTLKIRPDSMKEIVAFTNGAVKDAVCSIPLKFEKSEIYGRWIKKDSVNLPKLKIKCELITSGQEKLPVSTYIRPVCSRIKGVDWNCDVNMSDTLGLGLLGRVLESQVNDSMHLKAELKKFLSSM